MKLAVAVTALTFVVAAPAFAQMPPPPPPGDAMADGPGRMHRGNPMFAGMSDAGRAIMRAAMSDADPRVGREATHAARDRMLAIIDADRFDPAALKRAMDDEREAASAAKARHQAAQIAGLQQLGLADRRTYVANARQLRARVEERMGAWKERHGPGGPGLNGGSPPR